MKLMPYNVDKLTALFFIQKIGPNYDNNQSLKPVTYLEILVYGSELGFEPSLEISQDHLENGLGLCFRSCCLTNFE